MKKALNNPRYVNGQEMVDKLIAHIQSEDKRKKKKILIFVLLSIILISSLVGSIIYYQVQKQEQQRKKIEEQKRVEINELVKIETGSEINLSNFVIKQGILSLDSLISFENVNEELEDRTLQTVTLYFLENNIVSREEAIETKEVINEKTGESTVREKLKEGYLEKTFLSGTGEYNVVITDEKNNTSYNSKLKVIDTTPPILTTLESITITEGDLLEISQIVSSCSDNSFQGCEFQYVEEVIVEEAKEEKEAVIELQNLESIDISVGERNIKIVARDASNNVSEVKTVKLIVQEKPKYQSQTGGGYTSSQNQSNLGEKNNSTSNNTSKTKNLCLHDKNYQTGGYYDLTFDFGCNSEWEISYEFDDYLKTLVGSSFFTLEEDPAPVSQVLWYWLRQCQAAGYEYCRTFSLGETVFHRWDDKSQIVASIRGYDSNIIVYDDSTSPSTEIGRGHINSDFSVSWEFKYF